LPRWRPGCGGGFGGGGDGLVLAEETGWAHLEPEPLAGLAEVGDVDVEQRELLRAGRAHLQHRPAGALARLRGNRGRRRRQGPGGTGTTSAGTRLTRSRPSSLPSGPRRSGVTQAQPWRPSSPPFSPEFRRITPLRGSAHSRHPQSNDPASSPSFHPSIPVPSGASSLPVCPLTPLFLFSFSSVPAHRAPAHAPPSPRAPLTAQPSATALM